MISPKRIERLWKACPELRPFNLRLHSAGWFTEHPRPTGGASFHGKPEVEAHAIIRDKIQEHVNRKHGMSVSWCTSYTSWALVDENGSLVAMLGQCGDCEDYTTACIIAAERVMNLPDWTEPPTSDVGDFRT